MATLRAHANRVGLRTPSHEHAAVPSNRPLGPLRQGLEWVAQNHIRPAVVHMSVEGAYSSVVNNAVDQLVANHNLHVVVSSGAKGSVAHSAAVRSRLCLFACHERTSAC